MEERWREKLRQKVGEQELRKRNDPDIIRLRNILERLEVKELLEGFKDEAWKGVGRITEESGPAFLGLSKRIVGKNVALHLHHEYDDVKTEFIHTGDTWTSDLFGTPVTRHPVISSRSIKDIKTFYLAIGVAHIDKTIPQTTYKGLTGPFCEEGDYLYLKLSVIGGMPDKSNWGYNSKGKGHFGNALTYQIELPKSDEEMSEFIQKNLLDLAALAPMFTPSRAESQAKRKL